MSIGQYRTDHTTSIPKQMTDKTQEELNHPDTAGCIFGCPFWKPLHNHPDSQFFCAYLLLAGHIRGCDAGQCDIQKRIAEFDALPESVKRPYGRHSFCDYGIMPEYEEAVGM